MFSFNSPYGACPECKGLGFKSKIDEDLLIPDKTKSIMSGAVASFQSGETLNIYYRKLKTTADHYHIDLNTPIKDMKRSLLLLFLFLSMSVTYAADFRPIGSNAKVCAYTFDGKYYLILSY